MSREYFGQDLTLPDPSDDPVAVTPDDDSDLARGVPRWLYVGTAGDLAWVGRGSDTPVITKNAAVGYHPIRPRRIMETDTSAQDIVVFY